MRGSIRPKAPGRSFSGGFRSRLFSLLPLCEHFRGILGGYHGWRASFAVCPGGNRRFFWQRITSVPEFLLGLSAWLGGSVSSQPVVRARIAPHEAGMAAPRRPAFCFSNRSSLWALVFIRLLWSQRPWTRRAAVTVLFCGTFLIYMLTALTFLWLMTLAGGVLEPIAALNIFGLGWALIVGTWLALPAQPMGAGTYTTGQIGFHETGASVFSLGQCRSGDRRRRSHALSLGLRGPQGRSASVEYVFKIRLLRLRAVR
jgi:hypothetical protein